MSYFFRRDIDSLKPSVDKLVYKTLGNSDSAVLRVALDCLSSGYAKRKIIDKLSSYLDSRKHVKLADKIFDAVDYYRSSHRSKKWSHDEDKERDYKRSKNSSRSEKETSTHKSKPEGTKKKNFEPSSNNKNNINIANLNIPAPTMYGIPQGLLNRRYADKARKIAQLQAQIKTKLSLGILGNVFQIPIQPSKPAPLILDEDEKTIVVM